MHDAYAAALPDFCRDVDDAEFRMRELGAGLNDEQAAMQAAIYDAMDPTADWDKEEAAQQTGA
jgi:cytochrome c553